MRQNFNFSNNYVDNSADYEGRAKKGRNIYSSFKSLLRQVTKIEFPQFQTFQNFGILCFPKYVMIKIREIFLVDFFFNF